MPNREVFGTGIMLSGHANMSQAASGTCWQQLRAVAGSSDIKLSEYICIYTKFLKNFMDAIQ
jgi:hypothetical protein